MVEKPIDMSLIYKRKNTLKTSHIERPLADYSTVMKSINSNLRTNMPLTESYISACNDHDYANDNYDNCINILEAVKESGNSSLYNKLEGIFINNVIPHIEDLSNLKYRVEESGSIDSYNINTTVEQYQIADRILGNYDKINKRSSIDYIFRENTDIMDKCYYISDIVNNYNMSINNKISIALETCLYGLYKNDISHTRSEVLENVTDYFLSVNNSLSDLDMDKITKSIKNTKLVSSLDCKDLVFLKESEDYADSADVKKAIEKYKADQCKDLSKFKRIITKFYTKSPTQVIDELPNILAWIRLGFVFSTAAYSPLITVPLFIVDQFISMGFKRKEAERMVKIFTKERDKAESRSYTVSNSEKIDKYVKCLNTCLYKLEDYRDSLYSEKELEKRDELEECVTSFDYQITLEDMNIMDIKSVIRNLEKSTIGNLKTDIKEDVYRFYNSDSIYEYINENGQFEIPFCKFYGDYDTTCLYADRLSSIFENYVAIVERSKYGYEINLVNKYHIQLNEAQQDKYDNCIPYDIRKQLDTVATISGNIDYLNTLNPMGINKEIKENFDALMECPELTCRYIRNSKNIVDIKEFYFLMEQYQNNLSDEDYIKNTEINFAKPLLFKESLGIDPATDLLIEAQSIQGLRNIITEGVNTTAIKTACLNMKKKMVNLSAKEQQLSKNLDANASAFTKHIQKALTADRREAIIKGSIIPSFSRIIKMSLVAGATYLVAPTVAIIGTIGALGASKVLTIRERRALLDEIDIELNVVEKQIAKADRDDDMKNYRHLLTYQRKLEREKMRIQYNLGPGKQVPSTALAKLDRDND